MMSRKISALLRCNFIIAWNLTGSAAAAAIAHMSFAPRLFVRPKGHNLK
jgi:hypothetical protein